MTTDLVEITCCINDDATLEVYRGTGGLALLITDGEDSVGVRVWLNNDSIFKLVEVLTYERDHRDHNQNPELVK